LYVEDLTQREAAKLMGVTQPRIAQMHRSLLELGREQLIDLTV
jgi:DNA-directed RNA polymerase specialized sigma subunit